jgi:DNA-binding transcriptional MerR regulator
MKIEKQGLLKRAPRSEGGFRLFGPGELGNLKFIRKAQELGFCLQEIRELLLLQDESVEACGHVRELLEQKLTSVRRKIDDVQKLKTRLRGALGKCNRRLQRLGEVHDEYEECCPVLEELGRATANQEN